MKTPVCTRPTQPGYLTDSVTKRGHILFKKFNWLVGESGWCLIYNTALLSHKFKCNILLRDS